MWTTVTSVCWRHKDQHPADYEYIRFDSPKPVVIEAMFDLGSSRTTNDQRYSLVIPLFCERNIEWGAVNLDSGTGHFNRGKDSRAKSSPDMGREVRVFVSILWLVPSWKNHGKVTKILMLVPQKVIKNHHPSLYCDKRGNGE